MLKLNKYESTSWLAGYQCCVIIYTFISFGLILVSVFNQSKLMDQPPQFYKDWDNYLLEDIQIKQNCDEGFFNVLNFTWPGTEKGCDCTQSNGTSIINYQIIFNYNYKYQNYYYMECSQFMLQQKQIQILQFQKVILLQIIFLHQVQKRTVIQQPKCRNNNLCIGLLLNKVQSQVIIDSLLKGFQICAKRSPFTAMQAYSSFNNGVNFKQCGNNLNVPITAQCPISHFNITTDKNDIPIEDTGFYYNYQRVEQEQIPMTQFTIGYNSICFSSAEISNFYYLDIINKYFFLLFQYLQFIYRIKKRYFYKQMITLIQQQHFHCNMIDYQCYIKDDRFERVTKDTPYSQLLQVNDVFEQYNNLFKQTQNQQRNVNLFYKYLTKFRFNPLQQCQFNDLDFIYHLNNYIIDNMIDIQLVAQVIVGIQAGIFGFLIPFLSAISLIGCNFKYNTLNRKGSHYKDLFGFWLGTKMIGETLCTIILAIDMGYQQSILNHFQDFINADCSDSLTLKEISDFKNQYKIKVYNYVLLNFILCIITNITDIYLTYLMCRDKHKQGIITIKKDQDLIYPQMYTSTHPDENLIKSRVQIFQGISQCDQEKAQLQDVKIPDDNLEIHVPDDNLEIHIPDK